MHIATNLAKSPPTEGLVDLSFVYDDAPFPQCHAATIAETPSGLICAFFGGTHERHPDVCIYVCHHDGARWSAPMQVADGVQPDGSRLPTWNPVLFRRADGLLMLFYKVGPNPREWWGMVIESTDDGRTWTHPRRLPNGILGPIKNKPITLPNGDILSPTSVERVIDPNDDANPTPASDGQTGPTRVKGGSGWHVYFERSSDGGATWTKTDWVEQPEDLKCIQPSLLVHSPTRLQSVGRTKHGRMFETWSNDAGLTWSPMRLMDLPNCNSGTDAHTLADGRHLIVYNHSAYEKMRYPLNLAISTDGMRWDAALVIESEPPGQYSYPSMIQTSDGRVHVVYTWKRLKVRHAVIDPTRFRSKPIQGSLWPVLG
jgi:alpha-L-rhamnosidase